MRDSEIDPVLSRRVRPGDLALGDADAGVPGVASHELGVTRLQNGLAGFTAVLEYKMHARLELVLCFLPSGRFRDDLKVAGLVWFDVENDAARLALGNGKSRFR